MDLLTLILLVFLAANLALTFWLLVTARNKNSPDNTHSIEATLSNLKTDIVTKQMEGLLSIRESLDSANRMLNDRLSEGTANIDRRMAIISEIDTKLGRLSTQTKNIESIGQNIQSLSELLKPPKLRGNLGELFLENLLSQILPATMYETQHRFKDGQIVDAVVSLGKKKLPIDSKFPMESYNRSVDKDNPDKKVFSQSLKKYIDDISSKYIRPDENTTDFALMYIPAEAVYSGFIASENTSEFEYALSKRVIPSSPGHLYGFLASLSVLFLEFGVNDSGKNLLTTITSMNESLSELNRLNDRLNGSLRSASSSNEKCRQELFKLESHLEKLKEPEIISES